MSFNVTNVFNPLPGTESSPAPMSVNLSEHDMLLMIETRIVQAQTESDPLQRDLNILEASKLINALQAKRPLKAVLYGG